MYIVFYGYTDWDNQGKEYNMTQCKDAQEVGAFYTEWTEDDVDELCDDVVFRVFECTREVELKEVEKVTMWELAEKL